VINGKNDYSHEASFGKRSGKPGSRETSVAYGSEGRSAEIREGFLSAVKRDSEKGECEREKRG